MIRRPPRSTRTDTLLPYTTLFRSIVSHWGQGLSRRIPPETVFNRATFAESALLECPLRVGLRRSKQPWWNTDCQHLDVEISRHQAAEAEGLFVDRPSISTMFLALLISRSRRIFWTRPHSPSVKYKITVIDDLVSLATS